MDSKQTVAAVLSGGALLASDKQGELSQEVTLASTMTKEAAQEAVQEAAQEDAASKDSPVAEGSKDGVVAGASEDSVRAGASEDAVVTVASEDSVGAVASEDSVGAGASTDSAGSEVSIPASPGDKPDSLAMTAHVQEQLLATAAQSLVKGRYLPIDCFDDHGAHVVVTTRLGGVSKEPYQSFNVALHVGDDAQQVEQNRELIKSDWGLPHICFMEQTHSNEVVLVTEDNVNTPCFVADGLVTKLSHIALAVMTADCLPLMLLHPETGLIAAIHCGWRGIVRGIIPNALHLMQSEGAKVEEIWAFLGPAIGPQSFEVGPEVRAAFMEINPDNACHFVTR